MKARILINGKNVDELLPTLRKLHFKQPKRLSDIFSEFGLQLSKTIRIKACGNPPNIIVWIYKLNQGIIKKCITISTGEMRNREYLKYGLSDSLIQLLDKIKNVYCVDNNPFKPKDISFRVLKPTRKKPFLLIKCDLRNKFVYPSLCRNCFYFRGYTKQDNMLSVKCAYPYSNTKKQLKP